MKTNELTGPALNWAVRYALNGRKPVDYVEAITKDGTAEAAWAWHVRIVEAQRETQACYDTGEW